MKIYDDFIQNHRNYSFFDPEKVKEFLDLPIIYSLDSILPAFNRELDYNEIMSLRTLLIYKYREERNSQYPYLSASLQTVIRGSFVNLFGDKSAVLDCNQFEADVKKVGLLACRKCEKVITKPNLEMLILDTMPKLTDVEGLCQQINLLDLTISRTARFTGFDAIKKMTNLLFLNLSFNKTLENLDFLTEHHNVMFLDIASCPNLDIMNSISVLKKLKNLKHIIVSLKKKELSVVTEALPNIYINQEKFNKKD